MKKFFLKSKIFSVSASGGALFLLDAVHSFLQSPTLDNVCAQKSALAASTLLLVTILRTWFSTEKLSSKKE